MHGLVRSFRQKRWNGACRHGENTLQREVVIVLTGVESILAYLTCIQYRLRSMRGFESTALDFGESHFSQLLTDRIGQSQHCSVWQGIRHYIGRLGSWWKACFLLTSVAQLDPRLFSRAQAKAVRSSIAWDSLEPHPATTVDMLCRLVPRDNTHLVTRLQEILRVSWGNNADSEFQTRYGRRKVETFVHAEILVLRHFDRRKLSFADDVRYIGCSKPSCYCCDLYMQCHPLNVLRRQCHGNTWIRWGLPNAPRSKSQGLDDRTGYVLARMLDQMQEDIVSKAFLETSFGMPESTTGITSV